jgi:hypothetical protein
MCSTYVYEFLLASERPTGKDSRSGHGKNFREHDAIEYRGKAG